MAWIKDKVFANADDFIAWLDANFGAYISDHISENHVHHTYNPNHSHYPKYTTLQLHQNMRGYHVNTRGWDDIGQHITIGKDGDIVTGRDIQKSPASATGYNGNSNSHPFMYEMVGNFDKGNDKLEGKQLEAATKISRYFYKKGKGVGFHREKLINGKEPKSCPGTGVDKTWFMNLVKAEPKQNGWKQEAGMWYFYKNSALVKNDWVLHTDKKWYYLGENGAMATDKWIRWKNKWYYVDADGKMATGEITVKNKRYRLRDNGSLIITDRNGAVLE